MRSLLLLAISAIIFCAGLGCATRTSADTKKVINTPVAFDVSKLSPAGRDAYEKLLDTEVFAHGPVGIAATLAPNVESFNILLKEKEADAAFKAILRNGKPAGQLYGLSGLYFTDYKTFQKEAADFSKKDEMVNTISGCIMEQEKISKIVESNEKNVAIIKPGETMEDFWKRNKVSYELDIAHGGFPATLKYNARFMKSDNKNSK